MGLTVKILAYHETENFKWLLPKLKRIITPLETGDVDSNNCNNIRLMRGGRHLCQR